MGTKSQNKNKGAATGTTPATSASGKPATPVVGGKPRGQPKPKNQGGASGGDKK